MKLSRTYYQARLRQSARSPHVTPPALRRLLEPPSLSSSSSVAHPATHTQIPTTSLAVNMVLEASMIVYDRFACSMSLC